MPKHKLVIFDVDGTLLDTTSGVLASIDYTINALGLPKLSIDEELSFVGPPVHDSFKKAFELSEERTLKAVELFRNSYKDTNLFKASPYDGIYELVRKLKSRKVKIGVATYKRNDYAISILKHFKFNDYYDVAYGADPDNKLKKSDLIKKCIEDLKVSPDEAVMIGDTKLDAIGSEQIGCDFIGVTYGFGFKSKDDVKEYKNIGAADTIEELGELLLKNN